MYVRAISIRLLRGSSTPAIRAIMFLSPLALLVAGVLALDTDDARASDDLALAADRLHGCAHLHDLISPSSVAGAQGKLKIYGPSLVTATECSKWADRRPSRVAAVQPSSRRYTSAPPAFTIGSIARTMPSASHGPLAPVR